MTLIKKTKRYFFGYKDFKMLIQSVSLKYFVEEVYLTDVIVRE
jgi:hypothetical protein